MNQYPARQPERHTVDVEERLNASPPGQHLLLGELVLPIGEDPTAESRSVSDGLIRGWVDSDGNLQVGVFARALEQWTTLGQRIQDSLDSLEARVAALESVLSPDGGTLSVSDIEVSGDITHSGTDAGFRGTSPVGLSSLVIDGSLTGATVAVLADVVAVLALQGLATDSTTA